ncbi:energy transducer TonB [Marinobacter salicampi]|uniref:energy transducer TonB n=1 Tax=Marinobacter salicampi TaxID=435907 RepID=UPI00140CF34B|nr:energy transducer TonB [Marinobacter salicampi]
MLYSGKPDSIPAKYRIALAVSLALFFHSLLGALIASNLPEQPPQDTSELSFILVPAGANASKASPASAPAPNDEPEPDERRQGKLIQAVKPLTLPTPAPAETTGHPGSAEAPSEDKPTEAPAPASKEAAPSTAGKPSPVTGEDEAEVTEVGPDEDKETDYEAELARKISAELGRASVRLPSASARKQLKPIKLEVELMTNGTLIDARITDSSGNQGLDQSAVRAALRASPYPEPPEEDRSGALRYQVRFLVEPDLPQ